MYLSWYDPDRKKHPRQKLSEALARYEEKYGSTARFCLTSPKDAAELAAPSRKFPELPVAVIERTDVQRWTFYVGADDGGTA